MGILQTLAADVEAVWAKIETVAEADANVIVANAKSFLTAIEPSLLSTLLTVANDGIADLLDPATLATNLLNQAEAAGSALWNMLAPEAKTAAVNAITAVAAVNTAAVAAATAGLTSPAPTPAAPTTESAPAS